MTKWDEQFQAAEALRKSGKYQEAESLFCDLWQEHPAAEVGAGWVHCLRKLERYREAAEIGIQVVEAFPEYKWGRTEYVWSIFHSEVKPAKEQGDLKRVMQFAERMLELTNDLLATKMAVFAVLDVAKKYFRWDIVSSWCDRLDREQLSIEPNVIGERKGISDLERWYFAKLKALVELEQWPEVRLFALEASASFPRKDDFYRRAALARAKQGDIAGGIEELEALVSKGHVQWYILHELAELQYEVGANDQALRNACKAALAPGEGKLKVKLYELLARIQLRLGEVAASERSVELAKGIYLSEGWGLKSSLVALERQINDKMLSAGLTKSPLELAPLSRSCRRDWEKGSIIGQIRHVGSIRPLIVGKDFAFIAPDAGGDNIYVKLRDLPRAVQKEGARVEYTLVDTYDRKKDRKSVRATDVHPLE